MGFLEEVFVLSLALPGLAIDNRREEVGSVLGIERVSVGGGLLGPLRICDTVLEQFQAVCSSSIMGVTLAVDCFLMASVVHC